MFLYVRALNYFRNVSRETKRLESISRSPVYALFSETLSGTQTIRAFHLSTQFLTDFEGRVDQNTRASYVSKCADRWIAVRLETIGALIAGTAAIFASNAAVTRSGNGSNNNFASIAGLSLTFAISITAILSFGVRIFAQLEAAMNACERVLYYTEHIPQEAAWTSDEIAKIDRKHADATKSSTIALSSNGWKAEAFSDDWPTKGNLKFQDLRMRYRDDTPFVLKGLSATIAPGERVGVVGRTGSGKCVLFRCRLCNGLTPTRWLSGKSSLLLTLLRIVEPTVTDKPSAYVPPISIDGVDILRIGLHVSSKIQFVVFGPCA
jgi:ATP-binding cassette, subfamily C (CFTR/MRP), member 1